MRCHIDGKLTKEQSGKPRTVGACIPDQQHKARHAEVLEEMRAQARDARKKFADDKREEKRQKLMEGCGEGTQDAPMDLEAGFSLSSSLSSTSTPFSCAHDTVTREQMNEAWAEAIVDGGLPVSIVDRPRFRRAIQRVVFTTRWYAFHAPVMTAAFAMEPQFCQ